MAVDLVHILEDSVMVAPEHQAQPLLVLSPPELADSAIQAITPVELDITLAAALEITTIIQETV